MTISLNKSKCAGAVVVGLVLALCVACSKVKIETERNFQAGAEAASVYCAAKEDCHLCGDGEFLYADCYGQNNVDLLVEKLTTLQVMAKQS